MAILQQSTSLLQRNDLLKAFKAIRNKTEEICKPLQIEDYIPQPVTDVSPPRWHLAHTTWFFEIFLLAKFIPGYNHFHPLYPYIFNSYYHSLGERWERHKRGNLSRPTVNEVYEYRAAIDQRMEALINNIDDEKWIEAKHLILLGLNHEQQHQELLIYDIKYIFSINPLKPVYNNKFQINKNGNNSSIPQKFINFDEGIFEIGQSDDAFCFDNETPRHKVFINSFKLRNTCVSNKEYMEFMNDGGYENFRHWLGEGWDFVNNEGWRSPLFWTLIEDEWHEVTLNGMQKVNPDAPVTHISYFEAEAYASWAGYRLPTEAEWETAAQIINPSPAEGNFLDNNIFHPVPPETENNKPLMQLLGNVWEWTNSAYLSYPGYKHAEGALGEYNGKFMINQMVLRGGSCATPVNHIRLSYRNFFHPDKRWLFSGIRLASD